MFKTIDITPRWIIFLIDIIICSIAICLASVIRHNFIIDAINLRSLGNNLWVLAVVNALVFLNFKTSSGIIRYTGVQDTLRIFYAIFISTLGLFLVNFLLFHFLGIYFFSRVTLVITALISFLFLVSYRVMIKYAFIYFANYKMDKKNVVIYGAGEAGIITKNVLEHDRRSPVVISAFIDDDVKKIGKVVDGIVIRKTGDLEKIAALRKIDEIIIAIFDISPSRKNDLVNFCLEKDIKVLTIPPVDTWINGQFSTRQLQTIKIEDLLEREPIQISNSVISSQINNKRILVTGAAGSIGSELVRQLLNYEPATIILLDQAETPLYNLELELQELNTNTTCIAFLGDVTNQVRMSALFELYKPHYVYHAAAYKHVPMVEGCPSEAVLANVMGTKIIANLAVAHDVEKFVMISTDKAVNPTNVMGASKRLAEMYVQSLQKSLSLVKSLQPGRDENSAPPMKFITTRFGNVLGSNGSVISRFKDQIERGGPVTVTHPSITRFFMTITEASQLVLEAGSMGKGGEIFVFDMGKPVQISELARKMIRLYGLIPGIDVEIKYTGLRPGEKLYEELLTDSENTLPTYHEKIMIAKVRSYDFSMIENEFMKLINFARQNDRVMSMVAKMKELVPEFVSNNSIFQLLDKKKEEENNNLAPINIAQQSHLGNIG